MKLKRVVLAKQIQVGREWSDAWTSEQTALAYDHSTDMVCLGDDGVEVPRSGIIAWQRDTARAPQVKAQCPQCDREFNNKMALGGHLRQAHPKPAA